MAAESINKLIKKEILDLDENEISEGATKTNNDEVYIVILEK